MKVPKLKLRRTTSAPTSDPSQQHVPGEARRSSRLGHTDEIPESARSAAMSAFASSRLGSPNINSPTVNGSRPPPVPKLPLFGTGAAGKAPRSPLAPSDSGRLSGAGATIAAIRTAPAAAEAGEQEASPGRSKPRPIVPKLAILGGVQPSSAGGSGRLSAGKGSSRLAIMGEGDKENVGVRLESVLDPSVRLAEVAEENSGSESSRGGSTNRSAGGQSPRHPGCPPGFVYTGDVDEDIARLEAWEEEQERQLHPGCPPGFVYTGDVDEDIAALEAWEEEQERLVRFSNALNLLFPKNQCPF